MRVRATWIPRLAALIIILPVLWMLNFLSFNPSTLPKENELILEETKLREQIAELKKQLEERRSLQHETPGVIKVPEAKNTSPEQRLPEAHVEVAAESHNVAAHNASKAAHHAVHANIKNVDSFPPAVRLGQNRTGATVVVGIPSVKREKVSYLSDTLRSLVDNLDAGSKKDVLLIVMVSEPFNTEYAKETAESINGRFPDQVRDGLIEVICPPASFYPDLDHVDTLGDTVERARWRTKQNIDYAYLMMYAMKRGSYYLQLEDDVITKPDYMLNIKKTISGQRVKNWILIDFSYLGFIGKLFHMQDIELLAQFFLMFHDRQPVDWLLEYYVTTKACFLDWNEKKCNAEKKKMRPSYRPSLFQHMGYYSSLAGKIQKLKDPRFGQKVKDKGFTPHTDNPKAEVSCTINQYKQYSIAGAYVGHSFFWGIPEGNETCDFKFQPPIKIKRFFFKSGNLEHPGDKFTSNTTVEMLPAENASAFQAKYQKTKDNYFIVQKFSKDGIAEGSLDESFPPVDILRIQLRGPTDAWAILSEILITPHATKR
ncbi:alpha-1,3-mannosyl-glycoprotein 4-beta-N-acetylglucosaminyltransferase B [Lingula anatina]|uniref:Alpha-1,3-mannosyl-glycoprotein 4-beta-N-acetylglucosaminyltransferase B n=1 Tax=Lingula anatina TaxID=7574 RepID=A0A1S3JSM1_LINAN|nr:alpha-1,3-mannosyl-glycoprotein 4-beta-N-acetylglucosaminyltransferase B [Lingula anatina]XP_013413122.1 alpha-1,3-mannosyl-glycoprotein 4-beta-N-acetylglucosaminyltransferase B [Lingula anatina]|eukprot:XP_013413121.1 alpha-1,3-mannosyl-glycoprotein 4-beta-N-acetylglucosaminyltransferase B [Lingula anatina]